jgi:hypothetical protein
MWKLTVCSSIDHSSDRGISFSQLALKNRRRLRIVRVSSVRMQAGKGLRRIVRSAAQLDRIAPAAFWGQT